MFRGKPKTDVADNKAAATSIDAILSNNEIMKKLSVLPEDKMVTVSNILSELNVQNKLTIDLAHIVLDYSLKDEQILLAFQKLIGAGIFTPYNALLIASKNHPSSYAYAFCALHHAKLDKKENIDAIAQLKSSYIMDIADCIYHLISSNIQSQENLDNLIKQENISCSNNLLLSLIRLKRANILNQDTFQYFIEKQLYQKPYYIIKLQEAGLLTYENLKVLGTIPDHDTCDGWVSSLCLLSKRNLLTPNNRDRVVSEIKHAGSIYSGILNFPCNHLNQTYFELLMKYPKYAGDIGLIANLLWVNGISITKNITEVVLSHPIYLSMIAQTLKDDLSEYKLLDQKNFDYIMQHGKHADQVGPGLRILATESLLTFDNEIILSKYQIYAKSIALSLVALKTAEIANEKNKEMLFENAQYLKNINILYLAKAGILTQDTFLYVMKLTRNEHAINIDNGLDFLSEYNILDQENFEEICRNSRYSIEISTLLLCLKRAGILNENTRSAIRDLSTYYQQMANALLLLVEHSVGLLNQETFKDLINYKADAVELAYAFITFHKKSLLTPSNKYLVSQRPNFANSIAISLCALAETKMLAEENSQKVNLILLDNAPLLHKVCDIFTVLAKARILNERNFSKTLGLIKSINSQKICDGLEILQEHKALNQEIFDDICKYSFYARSLSTVLSYLENAEILTPANRAALYRVVHHSDGIAATFRPLVVNNQNQALFDNIINNILQEQREQRFAFLQGTNPITGVASMLSIFSTSGPKVAMQKIADIKTLNLVFEMAGV